MQINSPAELSTGSVRRGLILGVFLISVSVAYQTTFAQTEEDCESLPEEQQATCKLVIACNQIEDEEAKQKCFQMALSGQDEVPEQQQPAKEFDRVDLETVTSKSPEPIPAEPDDDETEDVDNTSHSQSEEEIAEKPRRVRGFLRRMTKAVTRPFRPRETEDAPKEKELDEDSDKENKYQNISWEAVVERVGRIDRQTHLVLLSDGKVFQYESPAQLRLRKDEKVNVTHVKTWMTEGYRIEGSRGSPKSAMLLPCHREELQGSIKRKCSMMQD